MARDRGERQSMSETERTIRDALHYLADGSLTDRTQVLLETLGYRSDRTINFESVGEFLEAVNARGRLAPSQLDTFEQWEDMDIVFQVTNDEVAGDRFDARQPADLFGSGQPAPRRFDQGVAKSFLFLAVDLKPGHRPRSNFTASTRAVNRIFPMPTVVFFRHRGEDGAPHLTIAVIHRRLHKLDADKDVLERVSLIKDLNLTAPHRAHLQLLSELALDRLIEQRGVSNFDQLLEAWEAVLDTGELNRRFYRGPLRLVPAGDPGVRLPRRRRGRRQCGAPRHPSDHSPVVCLVSQGKTPGTQRPLRRGLRPSPAEAPRGQRHRLLPRRVAEPVLRHLEHRDTPQIVQQEGPEHAPRLHQISLPRLTTRSRRLREAASLRPVRGRRPLRLPGRLRARRQRGPSHRRIHRQHRPPRSWRQAVGPGPAVL